MNAAAQEARRALVAQQSRAHVERLHQRLHQQGHDQRNDHQGDDRLEQGKAAG